MVHGIPHSTDAVLGRKRRTQLLSGYHADVEVFHTHGLLEFGGLTRFEAL